MFPIYRNIFLFSVTHLVIIFNYAQVIHGIDLNDYDTNVVSNQQPDLISVPEILNGILSKESRPRSTQGHIEYILIYAASLRNQITDIFGKLIYLQYQDLSITEIDALHQVYQEILHRKFNIFDILPEILSDGNIRPISVCGYMLPYASPCLKSGCLICSDIASLDRNIVTENVSRARYLPIAKRVFRALRRSHHYPHSNQLPADKRFSTSTVLSYLKAGKLKLTNKLLLGLLSHVEYDTFDSELRTAERHVIAEIYRRLHSAIKNNPDYTQCNTAGLFLKNYLPKANLKLPKPDDTFLAEHIRYKLLAVNENVEYLGYIYENGSINIKYLFDLILSNDTLDNDVIEARDRVRNELETYDILDKYLTIDKYQQISPDQLLLDILDQLKDINFMYNSVSSLYTHARFWRKTQMIENMSQLLELFDAFNNLRETHEHCELMSIISRITDNLRKSPNTTIEILCTRPRSCLRIALKIIYNCNDLGNDSIELIDRFLNAYDCKCSLGPIKTDAAGLTTTEEDLGSIEAKNTETVFSSIEIQQNFPNSHAEVKETETTLGIDNQTSVLEIDHSSALPDVKDDLNRTQSSENLCSNNGTDCLVTILKSEIGIDNKTLLDNEELIAEVKNNSLITEIKETETIDDTKKKSSENVTELAERQTIRPEGLKEKIELDDKEDQKISTENPITLDEETNDVLAVGHAKISKNDREFTSSTELEMDCEECKESREKANPEFIDACKGPKCSRSFNSATAERTFTETQTVDKESSLNGNQIIETQMSTTTTLSPISTTEPSIKKKNRVTCHHRDAHRQKKLEKLRKIARLSDNRDRRLKKHRIQSDTDQGKESNQSHKHHLVSLEKSDQYKHNINKVTSKQRKVEEKVSEKQADVRNRLIKNSKVVNSNEYRASEENSTRIGTDFSFNNHRNTQESSREIVNKKSVNVSDDTIPMARMLDLNMQKFFNFEIKRDETITDTGSRQKRKVHQKNRSENNTKSDNLQGGPLKKSSHCKNSRAHLTAENATDDVNGTELKSRMLDFNGEKFFNMEFKRDEVLKQDGIRSRRDANEVSPNHEVNLNTTENVRRTMDINMPKFVNFEIKRDESISRKDVVSKREIPSDSNSSNITEENRRTLDVNVPKFFNFEVKRDETVVQSDIRSRRNAFGNESTTSNTDEDRRTMNWNSPKFFNFEVKRDEKIEESGIRSKRDVSSTESKISNTTKNDRRTMDINMPKFVNFEIKRDESISRKDVVSKREIHSDFNSSNITEENRRTLDVNVPKFFNFEVKRDETIAQSDVRTRRNVSGNESTTSNTDEYRRTMNWNSPKFFNFEVKRDEKIEESGIRSRRHVHSNFNETDTKRRTME